MFNTFVLQMPTLLRTVQNSVYEQLLLYSFLFYCATFRFSILGMHTYKCSTQYTSRVAVCSQVCTLLQTVEPLCIGGKELLLFILGVRLHHVKKYIHLLLKCSIDLVHRKVTPKHTPESQEANKLRGIPPSKGKTGPHNRGGVPLNFSHPSNKTCVHINSVFATPVCPALTIILLLVT